MYCVLLAYVGNGSKGRKGDGMASALRVTVLGQGHLEQRLASSESKYVDREAIWYI